MHYVMELVKHTGNSMDTYDAESPHLRPEFLEVAIALSQEISVL